MSWRLAPVAFAGILFLAGSAVGGQASTQSHRAASIAAGGDTTCAITTTGAAYCWGSNDDGEIGNGTRKDQYSPAAVSGLASGVASISPGIDHTCAVTTSGGVKCWGNNLYGQVGDGSSVVIRTTPVDVSGLTSGVAAVSAGGATCALTVAGGAKCWGPNDYGQLGNGTKNESSTPVDVTGLTSNVREVSAGTTHACALTDAGGVKCWGRNSYGELGDGTHVTSDVPVPVVGLTSGVAVVVAGDDYSCALTDAGGVKCWGWNTVGELGDGTTTSSRVPVNVMGLTSGVAAIDLGPWGCALLASGAVHCWPSRTHPVPFTVSGLSGVQAVAGGTDFFACALVGQGGLRCWGNGAYGQLGDGTAQSHDTPGPVVGFGASSHVCVVPNVRGKRLGAAKRAFRHARCRVGTVRRIYSPTVRRGHVAHQGELPGTQLLGGTKVDLDVSRGKAACVVPDVYFKTLAQAKRLIRSHGCRVGKVTHSFATIAKGEVWEQTPPPRRSYGTAKRVGLVISKGEHKLGPPEVAGLSADGNRVAIHIVRGAADHSCHELWIRRGNRKAVKIRAGCTSELEGRSSRVTDFALAGTRVAWVNYDYGNFAYCYLVSASVAHPRARDTGFCEGDGGQYVGHLAGSGPLLVFNSWGENVGVWRLGAHGAHEILSGAAVGKVTSAQAGRFALHEKNGAISVYTAGGALIRHFAITAQTAKLDGSTLVAREGATLRAYDLATGIGGPARALTGGKAARFDDAARGIAAYTVGGSVHLLRLSDGKRATLHIAHKGHAYADISSAGLFTGAGRKVAFRPLSAVTRLLH